MNDAFSAALVEFRGRNGFTQVRAASLLDIPLRTWRHWETGERIPPEWNQRIILDALERAARDLPK